jgi:choline dehydrogenase-like flavoprotein
VLDPVYARAQAFLGLPSRPYDLAAWTGGPHGAPLAFEENRIETGVFQILAPERRRLGVVHREALAAAPSTRVYLHGHVLEIEPDPTRRTVSQLRLTTLAGTHLTAQARTFVAAAGGIENARLLLLSSRVQAEGLGN